jgi:superfamily I DNA/RNA helicase
MNSVAEIVLIHKEADAILAFFGEPKDVQGWIAAHEGLVIPVDYTSGRYSSTRVSEPDSNEKLQPPALTTETRPLLAQLDELNLEDIVPPRKIREALLNLDKESLDHEIKDTIDMVADEDVRLFLFDIINLIRSGDHTGAAVRLKLRTGAAVPLNDSGEFGRQAAGFGANSDQAKVLNNLSEEELNRLLDPKKFQDWMLFLHPDQQSLAEAQFDRPVILTGISGSGKTCVLVHRARYLARKYPGQKIGILTLSGTLAGLLQNLVNRLLTEEERKNVTVKAFYDVFRDCLNYLGPDKYFAQLAQQVDSSSHLITALRQAKEKWPNRMVWNCDPISKVRVEDEWDEFYMSRYPGLREWIGGIVRYLEENRADASRYLQEEFTLIRSQFAVPNRSNYLDTEDRRIRAGRAIQFRREIRQDSLRALLFWEEWLLAGGMIDDLGLTQALMPLHTEMQQLPSRFRFRCLLVDEFQDFSTLDLQLFRRIVPLDEPDALFLTGDTVQKILVKRQSLQQAGLERGSAIHKSILKNYRNSKQALRAASRLANHYGAMAKSQDEELEVLDPELAQRETNPPIVLKTDNQIAKAWELAIECTRDNKTEPWTVCIATANPHKVTIDAILEQRPKELAARQLSGDCILHPEEVVVGSISAMKGFEFRLALIIGCDAGIFPEEGVPHEEIWRDALRLYVAMTRGRDQVYLLHEGNPSEFIAVLGDTVITREEPLLTPYEQAETKPKPKPYSTAVLPAQIKKLHRLNMDEHCENWFSQIELEALNKYFARCVYRDGLTFKEWLKPKGLMMVRPKLFYGLHRCPPSVISGILTKLKEKGINP